MAIELAAERQRLILEKLNGQGKVIVSDLACEFGVTSATIRRDLDFLANEKQLIRVHGGALFPTPSTAFEPHYSEKEPLNSEKKKKIGVVAASMVAEGNTIFLDSGTTAYQIALNLLEKKRIKIVTTDLKIAALLSTSNTIQVICIGGNVRTNQFNCVGVFAERILKDLNSDLYFLAVDGVDIEKGITVSDEQETEIKRIMIGSSRQTILVSDSSKFGRIALSKVCELSEIDQIVSDSEIPSKFLQRILDLDIRLLQA